ncbi:MAG: hypothetical protein ACP6IP_05250 [Candidatus Njordarchaeia archaeon]
MNRNLRKFLGAFLFLLGFALYIYVGGYLLGLLSPNISIAENTVYVLGIISLSMIIVSSVYFSIDTGEKIVHLGGFFFLISFLLMLYTRIIGEVAHLELIGEIILLLSLAFLMFQSTVMSYAGIQLFNDYNRLGRSLKGLASVLALIWIIDKIIHLTIINIIFLNSDFLLINLMTAYIMGSTIESFGTAIETGGVLSGIKSALISAFTSSLIMVILSYIVMMLGLTSPAWNIYHNKLIYSMLILLVGAIIAYLIMPSFEVEKPWKKWEAVVKRSHGKTEERRIFVARKNGEIDLTDNVTILVDSGSIVVPFGTEEDANGVYIIGGGTYSVTTDVGKYTGSFDRLWLLWKETSLWSDIFDELKLTKAAHINVAQSGFISGEALLEFVNKEQGKILDKISKKEKRETTYIKLPFIEIYDGPDKEFVKVGPFVVYESGGASFIKIGPWKMVDETESGKEKRVKAKVYLGVHDTVRGEILFTVSENRVDLTFDDTKIKVAPDLLKIVRGQNIFTKRGKSIKVVLSNGLVLSAEKGKHAKLVRNITVVKASIDGSVRVVKGGKAVYKIVDIDVAEKVINKIYETGERMIKRALQAESKDEVKDLISFLDKLVRD